MPDLLDTIIDAANTAIEDGCETERWDDPGDYPSGAGGGPLPSYDYLCPPEEVEVVVPATGEDVSELVGETWGHRLYGGDDMEVDLRCTITKVSPTESGIAILVNVESR